MNKRIKKKLQKRFAKSWEIYIQEGKAHHTLIIQDTYRKNYTLVSAYKITGLTPIAYNPPKIGTLWISLPLPNFFGSLSIDQFNKLPVDYHSNMFEILGVNEPLSCDEYNDAGYITDLSTSLNMADEWVKSIVKSYEYLSIPRGMICPIKYVVD